ncbi:peptidoglycan hydrolase-like protein with peptidoglycan-binding domain [Actinoplanes octamycinicus]|uniref:Peptidoglycan hydrolase-like protein with peptidoglycan-binding domain n=1 Tax=Actinoplanes octamycinicus TaxID=135948 RepID=A0A7W7M8A1_9ACTN|nr:peptidoglycan-binding protein [Actinoplanes octamycinicus]MBB4740625.1 peptidoglycan hydrolase-like protein with peptidoglycan-binding domain [Actinoplanes octamycinicus]
MPTLQYLLQAHGHTVTVDGVFGAQTGDAVRAYQRAKGLPDNGVVGAETWQALIVDVRPGARGNAVRGVQHEFHQRRGSGADPDGVYGPVTESAVRAFQSDAGLIVDGVVGRETWQALVAGADGGSLQQAA